MSSWSGPWWLSPWGVGLTGRDLPLPCLARRSAHLIDPTLPGLLPRPKGGGSHGDTRWEAVPRIAAIWNKQVGFNKANKSALDHVDLQSPDSFGTTSSEKILPGMLLVTGALQALRADRDRGAGRTPRPRMAAGEGWP